MNIADHLPIIEIRHAEVPARGMGRVKQFYIEAEWLDAGDDFKAYNIFATLYLDKWGKWEFELRRYHSVIVTPESMAAMCAIAAHCNSIAFPEYVMDFDI